MNTTPRPSDNGAMLLAGALLFALLWRGEHKLSLAQRHSLAWILGLTATGLIIITAAAIFLKKHRLHYDQLQPNNWHKMNGLQFEDQVVIWLKAQGYDPVLKTEYFDQGLDILASKSGTNFGIQVKRSTKPVGVSAVRAAVAGLNAYRCDQAMVVTNTNFTSQALALARSNNCQLIDGHELKARYARIQNLARAER